MSKIQKVNKLNHITKINILNNKLNKINHLVTKKNTENKIINIDKIFNKVNHSNNNIRAITNKKVHKKYFSNVEDYNSLIK